MSRKVTNDLSAQMRSLAQMRGRNAALAERMVSESLSFSAEEALGQGVADLLASDMRTLLLALRGRTVTVNGQDVELNPGDAVVDIDMTLRERVLHFISSPDVAYLLLTAGALAVIFEILSPGGFVLGTAGAVMVLMGAFGLRMLPFNWAGIVLLVAGVAVLVVDLLVGGIGILSLFGIAAIATAGLILFRTPGGELLNVSVHFIVGLSVALGLFFLLVLYLVLKSQRRQASSGREGMIGAPVEVLLDLAPDGQVKCHGEIWGGRSGTGRTMVRGATGRVVRVEGMTLVIEDDRQMEKNSKEEKEGSR
ncbi:MAG TPA: hypothetical protein DIC53_06660 [Synergistaceae bacterium]|nr:hypothetical protein [Synergistaceae bacterium]